MEADERRGNFRYGGILAITLALALFTLLSSDGRGARAAEMIASGAMVCLVMLTSRVRPRVRRLVTIAFAVVVVGAAIGLYFGQSDATITYIVTATLILGAAAVTLAGVTRLVLEEGVNLQAVFGALSIYILAGLLFAFVIGAVAVGVRGNYFAQGTDGTQSDRIYFSFTTLTTTGYGDFSPALRGGRSLSVLEMLLGQLYLVTVIATLVGNLRRRPT